MNLPKSTYYYELSKADKVDLRNKEIKEKIQEIFTTNKGRYGVRRVHQALLSKGYIVNHKRVQRLSGLQMYPNLTLHGVNAIYHQY